jgi:hypothetical protein
MDTLLVEFSWSANDSAAILRGSAGGREAAIFRAIESDEGCAYVALPAGNEDAHRLAQSIRHALPAVTLSRFALLMDLPGASAGEPSPYHYVVATDVRSEAEDDFNAWYDREHLAGLASVPGTVRARRFRSLHGHPRYRACYDLTHPETLGSPPWLAVRGTLWSDRVRPSFLNTKRIMFRRA